MKPGLHYLSGGSPLSAIGIPNFPDNLRFLRESGESSSILALASLGAVS